ncbi:MAG: hypothetical protein JOS17DRAFT_745241 [Linnemannia elongata]|nr:MAG: hypothetical protein JOS17DRAFT_745241 [Linnemannia elongata]
MYTHTLHGVLSSHRLTIGAWHCSPASPFGCISVSECHFFSPLFLTRLSTLSLSLPRLLFARVYLFFISYFFCALVCFPSLPSFHIWALLGFARRTKHRLLPCPCLADGKNMIHDTTLPLTQTQEAKYNAAHRPQKKKSPYYHPSKNHKKKDAVD